MMFNAKYIQIIRSENYKQLSACIGETPLFYIASDVGGAVSACMLCALNFENFERFYTFFVLFLW